MMAAEELQCSKSNFSPKKPLWGTILFLLPQPLDKKCRWHREAEVLGCHSHWEGSGTLTFWGTDVSGGSCPRGWVGTRGMLLQLPVPGGAEAETPLFSGCGRGQARSRSHPSSFLSPFKSWGPCVPPGQRQNLPSVGRGQTNNNKKKKNWGAMGEVCRTTQGCRTNFSCTEHSDAHWLVILHRLFITLWEAPKNGFVHFWVWGDCDTLSVILLRLEDFLFLWLIVAPSS